MRSLTPLTIPPATEPEHAVRLDQLAGGGVAGGLITVDPGSITVDDGDPFGVTLTSMWGVDGDIPYYDDTNAAAGDEAALMYDPSAGTYTLLAYDFP